MEAYKVKYLNDHFIEVDTNDVIIPVNGQIYILLGEKETFEINKQKSEIGKSLNAKAKMAKLYKKYGKIRCCKILEAGMNLYFKTGRLGGGQNKEYIFQCQLLEDLYLYLLDDRNPKEPESWRLASCNCRLEKCLRGDVKVFMKLQATSLNKLYTNTVMHFFSERLSGSTNAFTTFFMHDNEDEINWFDALHERYLTLKKIRATVSEVNPKEYIIKNDLVDIFNNIQ